MNLPFEKSVFDRSFWFALVLAIVGWIAIYLIWGEFTVADIIGMIITVPIMAYLIHVIILINKET